VWHDAMGARRMEGGWLQIIPALPLAGIRTPDHPHLAWSNPWGEMGPTLGRSSRPLEITGGSPATFSALLEFSFPVQKLDRVAGQLKPPAMGHVRTKWPAASNHIAYRDKRTGSQPFLNLISCCCCTVGMTAANARCSRIHTQ
jgi:hypothetical protein